MAVAGPSSPPKRPRRWLRFSLRTMLVLMVLTSLALGWLGNTLIRVRQQREIVAEIEAAGGKILYEYQLQPREFGEDLTPPGPKLLRMLLGDDAFAQVAWVQSCHDGESRLTNQDLERLHELPALWNLDLHGAGISDKGVDQIKRLAGLKWLSLWETRVTGQGLARLSTLDKLEYLGLSGDSVTDDTLQGVSKLSQLDTVMLGRTAVTSAGLSHIAALSNLKDLRIYQVSGVDNDGLRHVSQLRTIERFHCWGTSVSDDGLVHLRGLNRLRELWLCNMPVGDSGAQHLEGLTSLKWLSLSGTMVGDQGLVHLRRLRELEHLDLGWTQITDEGMPHLAELVQLRKLVINSTAVTDQGLIKLAALKELRWLNVGPHVTLDGANKLKQSLPDCRIESYGSNNRFTVP